MEQKKFKHIALDVLNFYQRLNKYFWRLALWSALSVLDFILCLRALVAHFLLNEVSTYPFIFYIIYFSVSVLYIKYNLKRIKATQKELLTALATKC